MFNKEINKICNTLLVQNISFLDFKRYYGIFYLLNKMPNTEEKVDVLKLFYFGRLLVNSNVICNDINETTCEVNFKTNLSKSLEEIEKSLTITNKELDQYIDNNFRNR